MVIRLTLPLMLVVLATGCAPTAPRATASTEPEIELAATMASIQRWTDKAGRAGAAANWPLADFYVHELEEATATLIASGLVYDSHEIARLTEALLLPAVEALEDAVDEEDVLAFTAGYNHLIATCNLCHDRTDHGFIQIAPPDLTTNPWAQTFSPQ